MFNFQSKKIFLSGFLGFLLLVLAVPNQVQAEDLTDAIPLKTIELNNYFIQDISPEIQTSSLLPKEFIFQTEKIKADFDFNAFGVLWEDNLKDSQSVAISVELFLRGSSLGIFKLENLEEIVSENQGLVKHSTNPNTVAQADEFVVFIKIDEPTFQAVINKAELVYYDTRSSLTQNEKIMVADTANNEEVVKESEVPAVYSNTPKKPQNKLSIISRQEWEADESLTLKKDGSLSWAPEYKKLKAFIIHHTASTDGGDNPAASVRAIYEWHARVLHWGDIGYNFIIDKNGNIYKGRKGEVADGQAVVGGHTFNSITDKNYNEGSVGIALLGCYQNDKKGSCSTPNSMTPAMRKSLTNLIAVLAVDAGFDPNSRTTLLGTSTQRLVGHRDLDSTLCPGNTIWNDLPALRQEVAEKFKELSVAPFEAHIEKAQLDRAEVTTDLQIEAGKVHQAVVVYKNNGRKAWKQEDLYLKVYDESGHNRTDLGLKAWSDIYGKFYMNESEVAPGQTATFTFSLKSPTISGTIKLVTKLFVRKNKVANSNGYLELQFVHSYLGQTLTNNFPLAMFQKDTKQLSVSYQNIGDKKWGKNVALYLNGRMVGKFAQSVLPGETATITFPFTAPKKQQEPQRLVFMLKRQNIALAGTRA